MEEDSRLPSLIIENVAIVCVSLAIFCVVSNAYIINFNVESLVDSKSRVFVALCLLAIGYGFQAI